MLFAGLQRQHKGTLSVARLFTFGSRQQFAGHADDTPRHLADELLRTTHISYVGSAKLHGNAQRLTIAYGNVGAPFGRRLQHGKVGSDAVDNKERLVLMTGIGKTGEVFDDTIDIRLLYDDACHAALCQLCFEVLPRSDTIFDIQHGKLYTLMQGVGLDDLDGLGIHGTRHEDTIRLLACCHGHHHGLGTSCRAIVHRCIGNVHARQFSHHGLILKDIVQRSLRYFRLIRRVAGQEFRALQQLRNGCWRIVVIDAKTRKARQRLVLCP